MLPPSGWRLFAPEAGLAAWCDAIRPVGRRIASDPAQEAAWLRHGGTWFAGVDALPNDAEGRVGQGPALSCAALAHAETLAGKLPLHAGQLSVTYPGYPKQDPGDSETSFGYRLRRDAAHLDGLLPVGEARLRMVREPHAWILGLPIDPMRSGQAPLVVWEGSQEILCQRLRDAFGAAPPETWPDIDVTEVYQAARRQIFAQCKRVEVTAEPGEAILLHRLILHGVAPWPEAAGTAQGAEARAVVYFRPLLPGGISDWLTLP